MENSCRLAYIKSMRCDDVITKLKETEPVLRGFGVAALYLFGSHARFRIETLEQGDVGYIPQGYGHSIENVGERPARVLIGLNAGTYETIDLSQWIAGNPADVLATNFAQPPELFAKFPHRDVFRAP